MTVHTQQGINLGGSGTSDVEIRAVRDAENIYFAFRWWDPTHSIRRMPLLKKEDGWHVLQDNGATADVNGFYEDKFAVAFGHNPAFGGGDSTHLGKQPLADKPASIHGRGFWMRPMLVEIVAAVGVPALYWWEVGQTALVKPIVMPPSETILHAQYVCHLMLMVLMLAASLIDVLSARSISGRSTLPSVTSVIVVAAPLAAAVIIAEAAPWPVTSPMMISTLPWASR